MPPPPRPEIREEAVADPRLRKQVGDNNRIIARLRMFLDAADPAKPGMARYDEPTIEWLKSTDIDPEKLANADPAAVRLFRQAGAKLVFAAAREVSRRPGYDNFKMGKAPRAEPDMAASRLIASVLLARLEEGNATLALVDAHKRDGRQRIPKITAGQVHSTHG